MILKNKKILIVDDEILILDLLKGIFLTEEVITLKAETGQDGMNLLQEHTDIAAIILDWGLPDMTGLDFLHILKKQSVYNNIPVIIQTGNVDANIAQQGLQAGAYYFLTKPCNIKVLLTILRRAVTDFVNQKRIEENINNGIKIFDMMVTGEIRFQTPEEALKIASFISSYLASAKIAIPLSELFLNAIEHGCLEIGYTQKEILLLQDSFEQEVIDRLSSTLYKRRYVSLKFWKANDGLKLEIDDHGNGFEYGKYLRIEPDRVFQLHGRGIAMAYMILGDDMKYSEKGNIVEINLKSEIG